MGQNTIFSDVDFSRIRNKVAQFNNLMILVVWTGNHMEPPSSVDVTYEKRLEFSFDHFGRPCLARTNVQELLTCESDQHGITITQCRLSELRVCLLLHLGDLKFLSLCLRMDGE